jgi:iron complex transport system permease protein
MTAQVTAGSDVIKSCSLCDARFGCARGRPGCWCEGVRLQAEALAEVRRLATDCVCPECLAGFASREAVPTGGGAGVVWAKAVPDVAVSARGLRPVWALAALALLAGSLLVGLAIGPAQIGPAAIVGSVLAHLPLLHHHSPLTQVDEAILWQIRAPRVVLAALVGSMLAVAGSAYQGVFRNPLADPYLLGVAAGAGLGATLAIAFGAGGAVLAPAAFVGAALAVAAAYGLGRSTGGSRGTTTLVLAGVIVALFATAVQTLVQQQRSQTLREVYAWILGGFGAADWSSVLVIAPYVALSCAVILLHRRMLDVMRLGDDEASSLGIDAGRTRLLLVVAATLGTAAAVAVSGLIGFVGIIAPHTVRLVVSPSYRAIVPLALLGGAAFLVLADVLARTLLAPAELPIGVVTAFFGAPFFALVLRSTRTAAL